MTIERFGPSVSRFDAFAKFDNLSKLHKFDKHNSKKIDKHIQSQNLAELKKYSSADKVLNQKQGIMRIHHPSEPGVHFDFKSEVFSPVQSNTEFAQVMDKVSGDKNIQSLDTEIAMNQEVTIKEPFAIVDKKSVDKNFDKKSDISHYHVANLFSRIDYFHAPNEVRKSLDDIV